MANVQEVSLHIDAELVGPDGAGWKDFPGIHILALGVNGAADHPFPGISVSWCHLGSKDQVNFAGAKGEFDVNALVSVATT